MAKVPDGVETLRKISILLLLVGCTNVTDRQTTDRRRTDRRTDGWDDDTRSRSLKIETCRHTYIVSKYVYDQCRNGPFFKSKAGVWNSIPNPYADRSLGSSVLASLHCSVGRYHRLCATVSTVKKYRGTRYYRDGTFAITSTGRPAGITGKFRGGMGTVPRNSRWDVGDSPIFRKYYYNLTVHVFSNAYLRYVTMGWICLSSVYDEKTVLASAFTKCFVVVCSKKF